MPRILQSKNPPENTGRSVGAPALFASFPEELQTELRAKAIRRSFAPGQFLHQRGDAADGFWIVENGQVKCGHQDAQGNMHVLFILGPGDSFGELACLGQFERVLDIEALGKVDMLWVSEKIFIEAMGRSPDITRAMLKILAKQLQEALDNLLVFRNMSAPKRLAQRLIAFAGDRPPPVKLGIKQQELAGRRVGIFASITKHHHFIRNDLNTYVFIPIVIIPASSLHASLDKNELTFSEVLFANLCQRAPGDDIEPFCFGVLLAIGRLPCSGSGNCICGNRPAGGCIAHLRIPT
jgi:CRP-like cAMP-binding protein